MRLMIITLLAVVIFVKCAPSHRCETPSWTSGIGYKPENVRVDWSASLAVFLELIELELLNINRDIPIVVSSFIEESPGWDDPPDWFIHELKQSGVEVVKRSEIDSSRPNRVIRFAPVYWTSAKLGETSVDVLISGNMSISGTGYVFTVECSDSGAWTARKNVGVMSIN